jgi:Xaa-Pro aminopeptidase
MTDRYQRVTAALTARKLAGLVLMPAANLAYLTGLAFHPGKRLTLLLVPADGSDPALIVPALEHARAAGLVQQPMRFFPWTDAEGPAAATQAAVEALFGPDGRALPLAVEHTVLRVGELRALEAAWPGLQTVDADPLMADLRMVKDADELAAMQRAAAMIDAALHAFVPQLRVGRSERELSRLLSEAILSTGADGEAFSNMVASGPNAANPHHENGDRQLQAGDLVIIDCGARWNGYLSDITRTFAIGEPGDEARNVYALVEAANAAGKAACRPGSTCTACAAWCATTARTTLRLCCCRSWGPGP